MTLRATRLDTPHLDATELRADQTPHPSSPDVKRPGPGRGLRLLDFCATAVLAAGALAVLANALMFQLPRSSLKTSAITNGATDGGTTRTTSIPLAGMERGTAPAPDDGLGLLISRTPVVNMDDTLVPVKRDAPPGKALTTPKRIGNTHPPPSGAASSGLVPPKAIPHTSPTQASSTRMMPNSAPAPASTQAEILRPPASVPASPRTLAVQQALAKLGYGALKADGVEGAATRQAVQRFQQDHGLAVTGEIDAKLIRELSAMSGMKLP